MQHFPETTSNSATGSEEEAGSANVSGDLAQLLSHQTQWNSRRASAMLLAYKMHDSFAVGINRMGRSEVRKIASTPSHPLASYYGDLLKAEAHLLLMAATNAHGALLENLTVEATRALPPPPSRSNSQNAPPARARASPGKQPTAALAEEVASIATQRKRPNSSAQESQEPARKRPPPPVSGSRGPPPTRPPSKQSRASPTSSPEQAHASQPI